MWQRVWIWERKRKKGKTYCLRWRDDGGRVRTEAIGSDRKLAERLRSKRESELNSGKHREVRAIHYDEFVKEELAIMSGRLAEGSVVELEQTLRSFKCVSEPAMLADVTPGMVDGYFTERLKEVSRATANKNLRTLKASLNRAVRRGYLALNPAAEVKQVREAEKAVRVLSTEEIERLLEACPSVRWRALIALAVYTGMRRGELLALRWRDVDLDTGTVWVRNTSEHLTKSRKNRVLALGRELCELLRELARKGELVFHSQHGGAMANNVQRDFNRIVEKAGIERCTLHDLRRTFVTHLAMAGVNAAVVKKLAGHASIGTTVRYYTNVMPEALRLAQAQLPFEKMLGVVSNTDREGANEEKTEKGKIISLARHVG